MEKAAPFFIEERLQSCFGVLSREQSGTIQEGESTQQGDHSAIILYFL